MAIHDHITGLYNESNQINGAIATINRQLLELQKEIKYLKRKITKMQREIRGK